jgi:hypothetical protein
MAFPADHGRIVVLRSLEHDNKAMIGAEVLDR